MMRDLSRIKRGKSVWRGAGHEMKLRPFTPSWYGLRTGTVPERGLSRSASSLSSVTRCFAACNVADARAASAMFQAAKTP